MKKQIRTFSNDDSLVKERRAQIAKVASRLFIQKRYQWVTTRELCEALGMSKGNLYHYIGTKEDIPYLCIEAGLSVGQEFQDSMQCEVEGLSRTEALRESIRLFFEHIDEIQDIYNLTTHAMANLNKEDRKIVYEASEKRVAYFEKLLRDGIEAGEFAVDNPRLVAHDIIVAGEAWASRRWYLRKFYTLEEYTREYNEFILKAIRAGAGPPAVLNQEKRMLAGKTS